VDPAESDTGQLAPAVAAPHRREFDLSDRSQRARVYEIVLREGNAEDIGEYIDGALLADLWQVLILPVQLRRAWQPLIDAAIGHAD
jgi:hypothetical protein